MMSKIKISFLTAALFAAVLLYGRDALLDQARSGDTASQLQLAGEFFYGKNRRINRVLAFYWFRKAAAAGSPEAQYSLGICLLNGTGCGKNPAAALHFLEKSMNNGIRQAALPYAKLLLQGAEGGEFDDREFQTVKPDRKKALAILRKVAATGQKEAMVLLAKALYADVENHGAELAELLKKYCEGNSAPDPEALIIYAACLRSGLGGMIPAPAAGAKIIQKAAEMKHPEAMAQLAEIYYFGFGLPADRKKALSLYRKAVDAGSSRAMTGLGQLKLAGLDIPHDPAGAFKLFSRAAQQNYPPALRKMGDCCAVGIGTAKNFPLAMSYYHRAAQAGDLQALYRLGESYRDGRIIAKNHYAAFYYFQQAALAGHPGAMREAGKALTDGRGTDRDQRKGEEFLRRAAEAGDPEAAAFLRRGSSLF